MLLRAFIFFVFTLIFVTNCGKKSSNDHIKVKPSLKRIEVSNYTGLTEWSLDATTGAIKTTNVTIKSLKYPIGGISLSEGAPAGQTASAAGSNAMEIYTCSGSDNDSCLVELTGTALTDLLKNATETEARDGTFTQINITPCYSGGTSENVRIKLTAEAVIAGVTYYTNTLSGLSTSGPAEEVTFAPNGGCNSVRYLTRDIVIDGTSYHTVERPIEGSTETKKSNVLNEAINIKLYFDLSNAVIALGPSTDANAANETSESGFCKGSGTRVNPSVCINFPEIVATVDDGTPTLTRMLINSSTIWGFYSNSSGTPFGAYQRSYYNGSLYNTSNEPSFLVGSMFERFQVNADGSISFQQYDDGQNRNIKVSNFTLSDHAGTMTQGSTSITYTAVKI